MPKCWFCNDTRHSVLIHDYDGKRWLEPGETESNWLLAGYYYVDLYLKHPNGERKESFYGSRYQNKTHYISRIFNVESRSEEQARLQREKAERDRLAREKAERDRLEREQREQEERDRKAREESERRERERRAREERERRKREERERRAQEERERREREERERREREERERREREERERKERERREQEERERKKREQRAPQQNLAYAALQKQRQMGRHGQPQWEVDHHAKIRREREDQNRQQQEHEQKVKEWQRVEKENREKQEKEEREKRERSLKEKEESDRREKEEMERRDRERREAESREKYEQEQKAKQEKLQREQEEREKKVKDEKAKKEKLLKEREDRERRENERKEKARKEADQQKEEEEKEMKKKKAIAQNIAQARERRLQKEALEAETQKKLKEEMRETTHHELAKAKKPAKNRTAEELVKKHRDIEEKETEFQKIARERRERREKEEKAQEQKEAEEKAEQKRLAEQEEMKKQEEAEWNAICQKRIEAEEAEKRAFPLETKQKHQMEQKREEERKNLESEQKRHEEVCRAEEQIMVEFKRNCTGKEKCSGMEYLEGVEKSKEISHQSKFSHQLLPAKMVSITPVSDTSDEVYYTSSSYCQAKIPIHSMSLKDFQADETMLDDESQSRFEILHLIQTSHAQAKDREWLRKAQTFCLYHFSQKRKLEEEQLDMLLYALSLATSSFNDDDFLLVTKVLSSFLVTPETNYKVWETSFLRAILYCSGLSHGYFRGKRLAISAVPAVADNDLLQFVPAFTEFSMKCFTLLIAPHLLPKVEQTEQLFADTILAHQISCSSVKEAFTSSQNPLSSLNELIEQRLDKSLGELLRELSDINPSLTFDMKVAIMNCLSSEKLDCYDPKPNLKEAKEALTRISNNSSTNLVNDLILAIRYLSYGLYKFKAYKPRLTQLICLCILILSQQKRVNRLLEVLTGEGKSCIIAMFAAALGLQGKKVDIVTSSQVLAARDALTWGNFYQTMFGLTATHNTETMELLNSEMFKADSQRGDTYSYDIVYGTVSSFSADILRQKFEMRNVRGNRGFQAAIIDEVDMLMMDEGVQFTYLSHELALLRHLESVLSLIYSAVQKNAPLATVDGSILFAEAGKDFDSVILEEIDLSEHLELEDEVLNAHELEGPDKTTAILSLIKKINAIGNICFQVYIFQEDGRLKQDDSEISSGKEQTPLLVLDNGKVHKLYTQDELSEGVQGVILSQCDISTQSIFQTKSGTAYLPGRPGIFDKVLSRLGGKCAPKVYDLVKNAIKQKKIIEVRESKDERKRANALEDIKADELVLYIKELNFFQSAFYVNAYTLDRAGKLEQATIVSEPTRKINISVLVKDKGILHPLYTLEEANTNQDDTFYTKDGEEFLCGAPDFLDKVIYPQQLLHYLVEQGIVKEKIQRLLSAKDEEAHKQALKNFNTPDILKILEYLEKNLPCEITAYTSAPSGGHSQVKQPAIKCEDSLCLLIKSQAELCYFDEGQEASKIPEAEGPSPLPFHKFICTALDSSKIFHLLTKTSSQGEEKPPSEGILKAVASWKGHLPFDLIVYNTSGIRQELAGTNRADGGLAWFQAFRGTREQVQVVVLENGMLCQLMKKEKISIPSTLRDFVADQLPTYIDSAFTAHLMSENREYLVRGGEIIPVDFENSGIIESNKRWGGGLQQMLEIKHHLKVTPMSVITNFLSHVGFFKSYKESGSLFGLSGTIGTQSDFMVLKELYHFQFCRIPTFRQRLLYERDAIFVEGEKKDWFNKIQCILKDVTGPKQENCSGPGAALVLCEDIRTAKEISEHLKKSRSSNQNIIPYTGNDFDECEHFKEDAERRPGDIIVATNLAGRGTDIQLTKEVNKNGGLFCLLTFLPRNRRVELQAFGRTARNGNPGSVQLVLKGPATSDGALQICAMREARERAEAYKLQAMLKTDVEEVYLREDLFSKHCAYLETLHGLLNHSNYKQMYIDAVNENWGQWLQTKQQEIVLLKRDSLFKELEVAHSRWTPHAVTSPTDIVYPPGSNFHHLVKYGNRLLFRKDKKADKTSRAEAKEFYTRAIDSESQFAMIAHYNRAYCRLLSAEKGYGKQSREDLEEAKKSLQVYKTETQVVSQSATLSAQKTVDAKNDDLYKQMEVRMQVLTYFEKRIEETIEILKDFDEGKSKVKVEPTEILEFIPEADIATNRELHGLQLLGLEIAFSVTVKPKFSWEALGVFLLGLGQIVAGVCVAVLSAGALSNVATGLIAEGVSDCIDGMVGMIKGEFDLKDWAISKACSIAISVACGAAGKFIAKGAKAAYQGAKAAYKGAAKLGGKALSKAGAKAGSKAGARVGTKAASKAGAKAGAKGTQTATKTGALKAVTDEARVMTQVARNSGRKVLSSNFATAAKYAGKELIKQGMMFGLDKLCNWGIEKIFDMIGDRAAKSVEESLQASFSSSSKGNLGYFVDCQFTQQTPTAPSVALARDHFESIADAAIGSLLHDHSSVLDQVNGRLRDQILPQLSKELKGKESKGAKKAAFFLEVAQLPFVIKSVNDTVKELQALKNNFNLELLKQCQEKFQVSGDCSLEHDSEATELIRKLKGDLVKSIAEKYGKAVSTVLQQNLTWAVNRGLSETLHKQASHYLDKKLNMQGSLKQLEAIQMTNYLAYMPPPPRKMDHIGVKLTESHANTIQDPKTAGTLVDLRVAVNKLKCRVAIEDQHGNSYHSLHPHSSSHDHTPKITLVYTAPDEHHPKGHYDVKIGGNVVQIQSAGNSCMFEALSVGLNKEVSGNHSATSLRNAVADEISSNPHMWHDHYKRKEELKQIENGNLYLLQGAGKRQTQPKPQSKPTKKESSLKKLREPPEHKQDTKHVAKSNEATPKPKLMPKPPIQPVRKRVKNRLTAITSENNYGRVRSDDHCEVITYNQKNGLEMHSYIEYDRAPVGELKSCRVPSIPGNHDVLHVKDDINMVCMEVEATKCNFAKNEGRCLHTLPSFKQISYANQSSTHDKDSTRPTDGSSPVSFHIIPSESGANAGTHFGNSIVTSEHYNQKERELSKKIKEFVGDRDYKCEVAVEFENLIPPGGIKKFVRERNEAIKKNDEYLPNESRASVSEDNIATLKQRFQEIGKIATEGLNHGANPQVQRVKDMTYAVVLSDGTQKTFPSLGRDSELYVHSRLTGNEKGFKNQDLKNAVPSRKQILMAPPAED